MNLKSFKNFLKKLSHISSKFLYILTQNFFREALKIISCTFHKIFQELVRYFFLNSSEFHFEKLKIFFFCFIKHPRWCNFCEMILTCLKNFYKTFSSIYITNVFKNFSKVNRPFFRSVIKILCTFYTFYRIFLELMFLYT